MNVPKEKVCLLLSHPPVGGFRSFVINVSSFLYAHSYIVELCFLSDETWSFSNKIRAFSIRELVPIKQKKWRVQPFLFHVLLGIYSRFFRFFLKERSTRESVLSSSLFIAEKDAAISILKYRAVYDFSKYRCVISTEEIRCNYFLANNISSKNKIGFIHPDYSLARFSAFVDYPFLKQLDAVCAVCASGQESLERAFPKLRRILYGFRTPIDIHEVSVRAKEDLSGSCDMVRFDFITVCRLDNSSKALDRLLALAQKLVDDGYRFTWGVVGDGVYRKKMSEYILEHGLASYVKILGHLSNPLPLVASARLFVLQSYYEGYPISVCEALILNVPALITDFPSSKELVTDNTTGFICANNFRSIYDKLAFALTNPAFIDEMHRRLQAMDKGEYNKCPKLLELVEKTTHL